MNRQNITLSLPKPLLKKAKVFAAKAEKSINELVRESLEEKISKGTGYERSKKRQLRLLKTGFNLGTKGKIIISREELHARS